ncbi:MAG: aromatic ring hydroxylase [Candidatus Methanolliviera hydrocarbonicum]|uniref:Aromatic ring hydroxylase n=1 Tax=Candidatus Methanolliviera hydrocarbonicum TaxID=2491085 RepID=A0A520KVU5_9EURY|nr:MAG: aromatic ring hydroxylase [Candidatus Methanolliviera hydrocarbonicum]
MALRTGDQYKEGQAKIKHNVYINGKKIENLEDNPNTKTVLDATAKVFDLGMEPQYNEIMNVASPLLGEKVSRNVHPSRSPKDLEMRAEMGLLCSQKLGTCNYRCVGCDTIHGTASVTYEMDQKLGTDYHKRFIEWLKYIQKNDLAVSGGVMDVKGPRDLRPGEGDPDHYVRVVEKRSDGVVLRGAKMHQSGAIGADETLVIPGVATIKGEEPYAVACAVKNSQKGITYISQYNAMSAEREFIDDNSKLGNPQYGQRETCLMVFDNVFVPNERVFMCGETDYAHMLLLRFAKQHRMTCGGVCKAGFMDLIIGGTQILAEYLGLDKAPIIRQQITEMVKVREISYGCAIAAAYKGEEEPKDSGFCLPNDALGNAAKLNTCDGFWEVMKWAGDIAGGLVVTMPSEKELENPVTGPLVEKYLKVRVSAKDRMRMTKFLQNWVAGLHGVGTWHGAGPRQNQMIMLYRDTDFEAKKQMAKELAGLKD